MQKEYLNSIKALKVALKDYGFTKEQAEGVKFAIEKMRELATEVDEKEIVIDKVSNLYKAQFSNELFVQDDYREGYNTAIRDVLDIIDPMKTRYHKHPSEEV